jgi:hypothetical protein
MEHTYHINDHVSRQIDGPQGREVVEQSNVYTILALLPVEADGRLRYRIKSKEENFRADCDRGRAQSFELSG